MEITLDEYIKVLHKRPIFSDISKNLQILIHKNKTEPLITNDHIDWGIQENNDEYSQFLEDEFISSSFGRISDAISYYHEKPEDTSTQSSGSLHRNRILSGISINTASTLSRGSNGEPRSPTDSAVIGIATQAYKLTGISAELGRRTSDGSLISYSTYQYGSEHTTPSRTLERDNRASYFTVPTQTHTSWSGTTSTKSTDDSLNYASTGFGTRRRSSGVSSDSLAGYQGRPLDVRTMTNTPLESIKISISNDDFNPHLLDDEFMELDDLIIAQQLNLLAFDIFNQIK
ncbi:hypothetical protein HK096_004068, partial [Nowakowskiella sp. JEL0078]